MLLKQPHLLEAFQEGNSLSLQYHGLWCNDYMECVVLAAWDITDECEHGDPTHPKQIDPAGMYVFER